MAERVDGGGRDLLTIREAAELLNVSAVSLRRWGNSGKLPCLRVGQRGERRFRRDDLLALLENRDRPAQGLRTGSARVEIEGVAVDHGSHLCSIYDSDLGRLKLSVPFLAEGLDAGDLCILVAAPDGRDAILGQMARHCDDLDAALETGRLRITPGSDSAGAMFDLLQRLFVDAMAAGERSIRLVGDMAWCIDACIEVPELMELERRYASSLARQFPVVALCQYDARRFSGVGILEALRCHEDTFHHPLSRFLN